MKEYKSYFMEAFLKDLAKSLSNISKLFSDRNIDFTVIGGAALNEYGYHRMTDDIDILVSNKDKDKLKDIPIGYMRDISKGKSRVFSMYEPESKIEIIYSGEKAGDSHGIPYEEPNHISVIKHGVPFLDLKHLIMYKLCSGIYGNRYRDFDDVQQLIRLNKLDIHFADSFRKDLKLKYIKLFKEISKIKDIF